MTCGFILTLTIRYVLKATWNEPLRDRLIASGVVLRPATSAGAGGYVWKVALYARTASRRRAYLGYISFFFGALYLLFAWTAAYVGISSRASSTRKGNDAAATAMAHQAQLACCAIS